MKNLRYVENSEESSEHPHVHVFHKPNYKQFMIFNLHSSSKELSDLFIAWLFVSIAFAIVRNSADAAFSIPGLLSTKFLTYIIISAITVGLAFLLHELGHKVVAQKYHCWAEFRADLTMLVLALLMSFLGFVFIAPGAVIIFGHINDKQNGIISMAGPLVNIILGIILMPFLFMNITISIIKEIISSGFLINAWLALFNMIPVWNFDGAKIWRWNKVVYFILIIIAALMLFVFFMKS